MKLDEYMKLSGIKASGLAKLFDISKSYVTKLLDGSAPSLEIAIRISRTTSGKVKVGDLIPNYLDEDD